MVVVIMCGTLFWNVYVGVVAAISSILAIWYFSLPPDMDFHLQNTEDGLALGALFVFMLGFAVIVGLLRERDRRVTRAHATAEALAENQRRIVMEMQRVLLPQRPVPVHGIEIAYEYVAGGTDADPIGGDWFAFVPVADRALGVAIGDVVGHGVDAVSAMVEYRFTMRIVAGDGCDPAVALSRLHGGLLLYGQETPATGLYGVMDADQRTWTYANAGHVPPLLVRRSGSVEVLDAATSRMFVPLTHDGFTAETVEIGEGDVLALYTDGLVERRNEILDLGIDRLARYLGSSDLADLSSAATRMIHDIAGTSPSDDVAVVLLRLDES
jgi:serine phosphatase RsbU (regulator of sigma subunit)